MNLLATPRTFNHATIVECSGRIVLGEESAHLRRVVREVLAACTRVVLDLGDVTYIDSAGLAELVGLYATARKAGGAIKLANLTGRIRDLLQLTRLLTVFDVYDRAEAAAKSFEKSA